LDIPLRRRQSHRGLEHREFSIAAGVLEEVHTVERDIRTGDHEVEVTIAVVIHRQGPRPQPHTKIDSQPGMVVGKRTKVVREGR
jgi:hypothetical protein